MEGSTRRWEADTEGMRVEVARHDELVRAAVERHQGVVFATGGDGFAVAFARAGDALACAVDVGRALGESGLPVARIGVHSGEAEERGGDYFGPAVNRTARLMAIGHGGQILVSHATEQLVRDSLGAESRLVDLGEHRLRDLLRPERVFQVVVDGQPTEFPPLRSLDSLPTNLPVQFTTFIGRGDELGRVCASLAEFRVVTITGVGGVGKTRLALQVAGELLGEFADGAWLCELASATDADSMVATVATTFGVQGRPGATLDESVVEFFRAKDVLLVLDNCEHLVEPAARLVDRVLRASPGVRVLATSREALDVDGERAIPLRSMTTASSDDLDSVSASDAARLFVERAAAVRAGFALDASNVAAVNTICRRLDGIPLAIELAAARAVSMTPTDIAALLDERFRLLTGGRRIAVERHQTLRAAVEWSFELLDDPERAVFARLAVFAGSFDGAAARVVVTGDDVAEWDVIDAIDSLVRKSLVIADVDAGGGIRYQMLETLRQYARDRLDEDAETDLWRRRHAEFFAELATRIGEELLGPDEFAWRTRLRAELDNIKAATSWAIDRNEAALAMRLIQALADEVLDLGTHLSQPATRALHLASELTPEQHRTLLVLAAHEAWGLGNVSRAFELIRTAAVDVETTPGMPHSYDVLLGSATWGYGTVWNQALDALARGTPETVDLSYMTTARRARSYASISTYALQVNQDASSARVWAERACELAAETQNPRTIAQAQFAYGATHAATDPDAALDAYQRSIDAYPLRAGAGTLTANARYTGALLWARRGDRRRALQQLRESLTILRPSGRSAGLDGAFGYAIEILVICDRPDAALVLIGSVLGGVLQSLREMSMPPDRTAPSVRALRDIVGREQANADIARGKAMTYDQLLTWLLATLDSLIETLSNPTQ
jgi:predicted ATPase